MSTRCRARALEELDLRSLHVVELRPPPCERALGFGLGLGLRLRLGLGLGLGLGLPGQPSGPSSCSWYSNIWSVCWVPPCTRARRNRLRMHPTLQKLSPSTVSCQDGKARAASATRSEGCGARQQGRDVRMPSGGHCRPANQRAPIYRCTARLHGQTRWNRQLWRRLA